jgi:RNA polymerase sigma-70 factor (ECF subfamily)
VADLLAQLPPDYREVVLLRNFQGLSFRSIALQLQRSEGAVRMLWLRALGRLRELLHASST